MQQDVQVAQAVGGDCLPEVLQQFAIEGADLGRGKGGVKRQRVPAAEIHGNRYQRFLHGQREVAIAADAPLVAESLLDRLTEADAGVLDRVVLVDVQVAASSDAQ